MYYRNCIAYPRCHNVLYMNMHLEPVLLVIDLLLPQIDPPVISRVSPQQITWVSGNDGRLQVLFEGGFPTPNVTWIRQTLGSTESESILANENGFLFSGTHSLNLTLKDVTLADAGNYSVTALNYLGSMSLWFWVNVIGIHARIICTYYNNIYGILVYFKWY